MNSDILLSGAIGALLATFISVIFQHLSLSVHRRIEVMYSTVKFFDEIYYCIRQIHQNKIAVYDTGKFLMREEDYNILNRRLDELIGSADAHARVALTYGKHSTQQESFGVLRDKTRDVILVLSKSRKVSWDKSNKTINKMFEDDIDPRRTALEKRLIAGATMWSVLWGMLCFWKR